MTNPVFSIAFYDAHPYDRDAFTSANKNFLYNIDFFDFHLDERTALTSKGYKVVCTFVNDTLSSHVISILSECGVELIAMRCAGYNNVDLKAAAEHNITVVRVPAYSPHSVAEHAAALLLSLTRRIPQAYLRTKTGNFTLNGLTGRDLYGLTAGILGTGRIGRIMADILAGFGMKIVLSDAYPDRGWADSKGYRYLEKDDFFRQSDIVSLHCPLTPETEHIINADTLSVMKRDAVIINTGRGALIDTHALVAALKKKRIGGAALDVYEEEGDYFFSDWSVNVIKDDVLIRLLTFPNVIITGHQAFLTSNALSAIAETTLGNIRAFMKQEPLANEVK
jgi:D-lactate dehydrogenase